VPLEKLISAMKSAKSFPQKFGDLEVKIFILKEREYIANVGSYPRVVALFHFPVRVRDEEAVEALDGVFGKKRFSYQNFVQWLHYEYYRGRLNTPIGRLCLRLYTRTGSAGPLGEVDLDTVLPVPSGIDRKITELMERMDLKT